MNNSLSTLKIVWNEFYNRGLSTTYFETDKEFSNFFQGDPTKNLTTAGIAEEDIEKCRDIIRELLPELDKETKLYSGIKGLIKEFKKRGYKLGVVSNSLKEMIEYKLKEYSIEDCIDSIIGYDEVNKPKPDPEGIIKCMDELEVEPSETIYVGDMKTDIEAGRAANVKQVIATTYGYLSLSDDMDEQLKEADVLAANAGHLYVKILYGDKYKK